MGRVCSSLSRNSPEHADPPCEMVQRQLPRNMAPAYDGTPSPVVPEHVITQDPEDMCLVGYGA